MGCWGSKTLEWGFAMAPHRLRVLVALFLQTIYAIEKLLTGFNVQPIIQFNCIEWNWYESVINLTALSRDAADDVTLVHPFCTVR